MLYITNKITQNTVFASRNIHAIKRFNLLKLSKPSQMNARNIYLECHSYISKPFLIVNTSSERGPHTKYTEYTKYTAYTRYTKYTPYTTYTRYTRYTKYIRYTK